MNEIFDLVYKFLKWTSDITGLTYREVNIIAYFMVFPSLFFLLISKIIRKKYPIIIFLVVVLISLILIPDFEQFSYKLFDESVDFLKWFEIIGLNYIEASVVICVMIPILIIIILLYLNKLSQNKQ